MSADTNEIAPYPSTATETGAIAKAKPNWAAILAGLCLAAILITGFVFWEFGPARFADRCASGYLYQTVNADGTGVLCPGAQP